MQFQMIGCSSNFIYYYLLLFIIILQRSPMREQLASRFPTFL